MKQTKAEKLADQRIERAYGKTCSGIQINIMDIPRVFELGKNQIANGATDEELGVALRGFVELIRQDKRA
jgi:hypothetical protein